MPSRSIGRCRVAKPSPGRNVAECHGWSADRAIRRGRATRIEAQVGSGNVPALSAFLTAVNADAPPLQWDSPAARNPVSWYCYHGGAPASQFGVSIAWNEVLATGLMFNDAGGACLRVTTDLGRGEYRLDRWE